MYKYEHFYYEDVVGNVYKDYTCYYDLNNRHPFNLMVNKRLLVRLKCLDGFTSDPNAVLGQPCIKKGTSIFVAPDCKYASNDVRRHYQIKRVPDSGDYNVFSPNDKLPYRSYRVALALISEKDKTVVACYSDITKSELAAKLLLENSIDCSGWRELDTYQSPLFYCLNLHPSYKMLLDGTLQKPVLSCKCLDLNGDMELNVDVLRLAYETANVEWNTPNAKENFLLQLNALNQYNWRNYPGTVSILNDLMTNNFLSIGADVKRNAKSESKTIREIITCADQPFKDETDFKLTTAFLDSILHIGDCKFCTYYDFSKAFHKIGISLSKVSSLFDINVRIKPKTFENVPKDN